MTVSLTLPRSPANLNRGNFMIALHLLARGRTTSTFSSPNEPLPYLIPPATPRALLSDTSPEALDSFLQPTRLDLPAFLASHRVVYTTTRPAIIPYVDPFASLVSRLLFLPLHVIFPGSRSTTVRLTVPMAEEVGLGFQRGGSGGSGTPKMLLLEVQAGQDIQVYDASVTIAARLKGLRAVMYRWRVTSFVVFSVAFWLGEMLLLGTAVVAALGWDLGGLLSIGGTKEKEKEEDQGDGFTSEEDSPPERKRKRIEEEASSPTSSAFPTPASEGFGEQSTVKKEEAQDPEGELSRVPVFETGQSTEADDEDEGDARGDTKGKGRRKMRHEQ